MSTLLEPVVVGKQSINLLTGTANAAYNSALLNAASIVGGSYIVPRGVYCINGGITIDAYTTTIDFNGSTLISFTNIGIDFTLINSGPGAFHSEPIHNFKLQSSMLTQVAGTTQINQNSNALTGTGSNYNTALKVGSPLFDNSGNYIGVVSKINDNGSATLYSNTTLSVNGTIQIAVGQSSTYIVNQTGTVSGSTSSTTVTGVGTSFTTALKPGYTLYTAGNTYIGVIYSIESDTSLTLQANAYSNTSNVSFNVKYISRTIYALTGSISVSGTSVTGTGTSFTAQLKIGLPIFNGGGVLLGVVKTITNDRAAVLHNTAYATISNATAYAGAVGVLFANANITISNYDISYYIFNNTFDDNTWSIKPSKGTLHHGLYNIYYPQGLYNSGENIFYESIIINAGCYGIVNGGATLNFSSVHLDYIPDCDISGNFGAYAFNYGGGTTRLTHCHIEGNNDTNYWLDSNYLDSVIDLIDVTIVYTGSLMKKNFPLGRAGGVYGGQFGWSVGQTGCQINFTNLITSGFTSLQYNSGTGVVTPARYAFPYLILGNGNIMSYDWVNLPEIGTVTHSGNNLLMDGGFQQGVGVIRDWLYVTGGSYVTGAVWLFGSYSLIVGGGSQWYMCFDVYPNDVCIFNFAVYVSGFGNDYIFCSIQYFDIDGNNPPGNTNFDIAIPGSKLTNNAWSRLNIVNYQTVPVGAKYAKLYIQRAGAGYSGTDSTGTLYIDDCYLQVIGKGGKISDTIRSTIAIAANRSFNVPGNTSFDRMIIQNTTSNAVTINFGTTSSGTDILSGISIAANGYKVITANQFPSIIAAAAGTSTTFYINSSNWNSASLRVVYQLHRDA